MIVVDDIWKRVAEIAIELHPDRLAFVASCISEMQAIDDFEKVMSKFGPGIDKGMIHRLYTAWQDEPTLTPRELAASLRASSTTASLSDRREKIEMVWTGPTTGLVPSRHTGQVLEELVSSAKKKLFFVSFVVFDIESVIRSLSEAIERGVSIDFILESSRAHGGKVDIDSIGKIAGSLPSSSIYVWKPGAEPKGFSQGSVHAKCAVADGSLAFVTSANLTSAAMERNMELGVLVRGGKFPDILHRHLESLVNTGIVEKI